MGAGRGLFVLLVLALGGLSVADIVSYQNHYLFPVRPEYLVIPKYVKADAPSWEPGHGRSFIDISRFNFEVDCDDTHFSQGSLSDGATCKDTYVDILMFEAPEDRAWTEYWSGSSYCCTQEAIKNGE